MEWAAVCSTLSHPQQEQKLKPGFSNTTEQFHSEFYSVSIHYGLKTQKEPNPVDPPPPPSVHFLTMIFYLENKQLLGNNIFKINFKRK